MRLALAQISASENRADNVGHALDAMRGAASRGADMVVFPELAVDRFFPVCPACEREAGAMAALAEEVAEPIPGPTTERVAALAGELGLVTVFNLYEREERGGETRLYDSSPVFDADGSLLGVTRMVHITDYPLFHERDYYHPGDRGAPVYDTRAGRVGVAICYDRHYPEYMRALALAGAQVVAIPQAGSVGEWPEGMYEAEVRAAAFQNGYFVGLCNRVGEEPELTFAGESFVVDPEGRVLERGVTVAEDLVVAELDLGTVESSTARRLFLRDRRPDLYAKWFK